MVNWSEMCVVGQFEMPTRAQPPSVLAGRIDALKQNPRWQSPKQCTDTVTTQNRERRVAPAIHIYCCPNRFELSP
jgi:hypothetical protein